MELSKNLTLSEACVTSSMADNTPSQQAIANLKQVAEKVYLYLQKKITTKNKYHDN